jgi:hypothetical protein
LFLVPGSRDTLRVRGRATIVQDEELRASMAVKGRRRQEDDRLLAEAMVAHGDLSIGADEMQRLIEEDYEERLY